MIDTLTPYVEEKKNTPNKTHAKKQWLNECAYHECSPQLGPGLVLNQDQRQGSVVVGLFLRCPRRNAGNRYGPSDTRQLILPLSGKID